MVDNKGLVGSVRFVEYLVPRVQRLGIYLALVVFAAYYLMPLFVMLTTSLKSLDENLLYL